MTKELNKPHELYALTSSPRHMPPDWKPPAPAWSASFAQQTTSVVMAYFGIQLESPGHEGLDPRMRDFFASADAPDNLESAAFTDRAGCRNLLSSAYWTNPASYQRWKEKSGFEAW